MRLTTENLAGVSNGTVPCGMLLNAINLLIVVPAPAVSLFLVFDQNFPIRTAGSGGGDYDDLVGEPLSRRL